MMHQALIDILIIGVGYDGTSISTWHIIWSSYVRLPRLLIYKQFEPVIELSCYFSWCSHANIDTFQRDMLISSPPDAIINAYDPLQNLSQTRIFYKVGQTQLTQVKHDPDDSTWFQRCT